jgi:hypothetical protein
MRDSSPILCLPTPALEPAMSARSLACSAGVTLRNQSLLLTALRVAGLFLLLGPFSIFKINGKMIFLSSLKKMTFFL